MTNRRICPMTPRSLPTPLRLRARRRGRPRSSLRNVEGRHGQNCRPCRTEGAPGARARGAAVPQVRSGGGSRVPAEGVDDRHVLARGQLRSPLRISSASRSLPCSVASPPLSRRNPGLPTERAPPHLLMTDQTARTRRDGRLPAAFTRPVPGPASTGACRAGGRPINSRRQSLARRPPSRGARSGTRFRGVEDGARQTPKMIGGRHLGEEPSGRPDRRRRGRPDRVEHGRCGPDLLACPSACCGRPHRRGTYPRTAEPACSRTIRPVKAAGVRSGSSSYPASVPVLERIRIPRPAGGHPRTALITRVATRRTRPAGSAGTCGVGTSSTPFPSARISGPTACGFARAPPDSP